MGKLYQHVRLHHQPRNVNEVHSAEQQNVNARIAVWLTQHVGTMETAYLFVILAFIGLAGILGLISPVAAILIAWLSQTLIQLVLLPVIMVGQNVLNRKQELQSEEDFRINQKSFQDIEQMMLHLDAQDAQILKSSQSVEELARQVAQLIKRIDAATGRGVA